ncbi:hypothetical protein PGTUg99_021170 [Puccinia graminis f. sp. tritici]|uniref:Uncharacterized protein n=1 Tax=Puccinia graminis f. sp. tritici TaxID=56615 RepID=A0A5B0MIG0_PUCGR|nr:hypothetical protein PGTUg99_021170 [Puccinia graminis f. sp. tritici]
MFTSSLSSEDPQKSLVGQKLGRLHISDLLIRCDRGSDDEHVKGSAKLKNARKKIGLIISNSALASYRPSSECQCSKSPSFNRKGQSRKHNHCREYGKFEPLCQSNMYVRL